MSNLFSRLSDSVHRNARRAVDAYTDELPDFRTMATNATARAELLDFAVLLRRRECQLGEQDAPATEEDLSITRSHGEQRGMAGVSLLSQQRVLVMHTVLTLRELQEAVGPNDGENLLRMLSWVGHNGALGRQVYTEGFLEGQKRHQPFVLRVQNLAKMLLTGNSAAETAASSLGMQRAGRYLVTVVRIGGQPAVESDRRDELVDELLKRQRIPITWHDPGELVALQPADPAPGRPDEQAEERARALVRDCAQLLGRPCAAGAAPSQLRGVADALALARKISLAAPMETAPRRVHTISDLFVELGVQVMPQVDGWLRELGEQLSTGPDLVRTLDAFYEHGMNRTSASAALHIHPRTLDYRLRRTRDLVGVDPASVRGVRVLGTAVNLVLAGAEAN